MDNNQEKREVKKITLTPRTGEPESDRNENREGDSRPRRSFPDRGGYDNRPARGGRDGDYNSGYNDRSGDRRERPYRDFNRMDDNGPRPYNRDNNGPRPYNRTGEGGFRPYNRDNNGPRPYNRTGEGGPRPYNRDNNGPRSFSHDDRGERNFNREGADRAAGYSGDRGYSRQPRPFNRDNQRPARDYNRDFNRDPNRNFNRDPNQYQDRPDREEPNFNREGADKSATHGYSAGGYVRPPREYQAPNEGDRPRRKRITPENPSSFERVEPGRRPEGERSFDSPRPFRRPEGDQGYDRPRLGRRPTVDRDFGPSRRPSDGGRLAIRKGFAPKKPRPEIPQYPDVIPDKPLRLNKYIANTGLCSRREADEHIQAGKISVNGTVVTELGVKVNPQDEIAFDGRVLNRERKIYLILNKPKGFVTTLDDPESRKTVMELVHTACKERIYPVGRLDKMTTGVLLFTNDGELALKLTHPGNHMRKVYHVKLDRALAQEDMEKLASGVELEDGWITPDAIAYASEEDLSQVGVEIHSGRNRVVRRMFDQVGYKVSKLDRVYFSGLSKKGLKRGKWRFLTPQEVAFLKMMPAGV
jgi:23S rRNA pseudouridine2605 synthase